MDKISRLILENIGHFLPLLDLTNFRLSCKRIYRVFINDNFWIEKLKYDFSLDHIPQYLITIF